MYYYDDYSISPRYANSTKAFVNAAIDNYNESVQIKADKYSDPYKNDAKNIVENMMHRDSIKNRYHTFSETLRTALVTEAVYKIYKESVSDSLKADPANVSVMRAIVNEYVYENGYENILNRMKTGSVFLSKTYNSIIEHTNLILEEVDKENPDTFVITPEMKDDFFSSLDYSDSEAISDAIKNRVTDAMEDFVTANTKDHEDITQALKQAQEKIENIPESDTELRECYEMKSKREISKIRNSPKGVLHSMVYAMCESVLKHKDTHSDFIVENHLDMDKIVDRVSLMYTFMETLNTTRIDNVNEAFIYETISSLRK